MSKVVWHTMMSLDGFIAGPNGDMRWMSGVDGGSGDTADEAEPPVVKGVTGRFLNVGIDEATGIAKEAAEGGSGTEPVRLKWISASAEGETAALRYLVETSGAEDA
jgi:hypothetical protein